MLFYFKKAISLIFLKYLFINLAALHISCCVLGFPGGTSGKEFACNAGDVTDVFDPWVGKVPWRRAWQPTPVFLPGESHGQKSLASYSLWGHEESDMTEWACTYSVRVERTCWFMTATAGLHGPPTPSLRQRQQDCRDPLPPLFSRSGCHVHSLRSQKLK